MAVTKLPAAFRRISMELAREPGRPMGDADDRYTIIAPLLDGGRLDAATWREHRDACRVVRKLDGETAIGHLVHGPGGSWIIEYDVQGDAEPEKGFNLAEERFEPGEYISIVREDGAHPYRVVTVGPV